MEHNGRLMAVLERLKQARVTLNKDKCKFSVDQVTFLGHDIDHSGVHPDPKKGNPVDGKSKVHL